MAFWQALDLLVEEHELVIDRPKGSVHPRYADCIYPMDYGYLKGTASSDGGGIDVWRGSANSGVVAIRVTVDLVKRDSEIKILLGCTEEEIETVNHVGSEFASLKGILIRREEAPHAP